MKFAYIIAILLFIVAFLLSRSSSYGRPTVEFDETFKDNWVPRGPL